MCKKILMLKVTWGNYYIKMTKGAGKSHRSPAYWV